MTADKLKQYIGLFGGWLGAVLLLLQSLGVNPKHFNQDTINTFTNVLITGVPFFLAVYGVYKNSYILSKKSKQQENKLKNEGLK